MAGTAALTRGYGPLEVFFDAEEGVSLKAENDYFFCSVQKDDESFCIEAVQTKDQSCKFFVENLGNGKVRLKDRRGFYLRRTERLERGERHTIEAQQLPVDTSCDFSVFQRNGKVIFQGDNGLFLSRIYWKPWDEHALEAAKTDADVYCEILPDIGDVIMPAFELISLECDKPKKKRSVVKEKEYVNKSSTPQNNTFRLAWEKKVTEVTTWSRAWGLNTVMSADTDRFGSCLGVTLWYDGAQGKRCSKEKTIFEMEEATVTVPPGSKITAKLIVNLEEYAEISFTARIRKTKADGEIVMVTAHGKWMGVVYDVAGLEIEESHF